MSSHDDSFVSSGSSPTLQDCWLTTDDSVLIEKGKEHRDYFVPDGEKPSKQFGLDLGHVRVSTLGTDGSTLHFEFKEPNPQTSRLILQTLQQSRAKLINLESHLPLYTLRTNLNPGEVLDAFEVSGGSPPVDLVFENHSSLFLIRPVSPSGQNWLDENVGNEETLTFGNAVVCEGRYVEDIFRGATSDGLVCR
jgi:hypothetical protein